MAAVGKFSGVQTSDQTTASTTYGAANTVSAGALANATYITLVFAQYNGGTTTTDAVKLRMVRGSTPTLMVGSEHILESRNIGQYYSYMKKFTAGGSNEDVILQFARLDGSDTMTCYTSVIIGIRTDVDLTEGKDFAYGEQDNTGTPAEITTSWGSFATSGAFTPDNAGDKWLACCFGQMEINSASRSIEMRMDRDSETETLPVCEMEGETAGEDVHCHAIYRPFTLTAAAHTFTTQFQREVSANNDHLFSSVVVFRMSLMEDSGLAYAAGPLSLGADDTFEELVATSPFTPQTEGPFVIVSFAVFDDNGGDGNIFLKPTVDGTVTPAAVDSNGLGNAYDAGDMLPASVLSLETLTASEKDIDLLGKVDTGSSSATPETMMLAFFSLELASAGPTATRSVAGVLPAFSGTIAKRLDALRAVAGVLPAFAGAIAKRLDALRAIAGTLPALSGALAKRLDALRAVSGVLPALSGALTGKLQALRAVAGTLPAFSGTIAALKVVQVALAGVLPAFSGTVARRLDALRAVSGTLPAFSGSIARVLSTTRAVAGVLPAFSGALTRRLDALRAVSGVLPAFSGTIATAIQVVFTAFPLTVLLTLANKRSKVSLIGSTASSVALTTDAPSTVLLNRD